MSDWWKGVFDEKYLRTYRDVLTMERTAKEAAFALRVLRAPRKGSILDVACGHGRHALEFARRGYQTTGVDQSAHFIGAAKREAKRRRLKVSFIREDMRKLSFDEEFDRAVNLFTSFGYFKKERDHLVAFQRISAALKPGGMFLIDVLNRERKVALLAGAALGGEKARMLKKQSETVLSNGIKLAVQETFSPRTSRWTAVQTWRERGRRFSYRTDVRLFTLGELKNLLKTAGLQPLQQWGNFDESRFNKKKSPRLIVLARKVKQA